MFVTYACQRDSITDIFEPDDQKAAAEFWNHTKNAPILKSAIKDLNASKNSKTLVSYISKIGKPMWDKSTEFTDINKTNTLIVPVGNDDKKSTVALLVVSYKGNYYQYHIVLKGRYPRGRNLLSAHQWDGLFAALDKELFGKGKSRGFVKERRRTNSMEYGATGYYWCWYGCSGNGNGGCIPGTEGEVTCEAEYGWYWNGNGSSSSSGSETSGSWPGSGGPESGWSGGGESGWSGGSGGSGGGTSGGNSPWTPSLILNIPPPGDKITNILDYLKCFNTSSNAIVNIYVDQPTTNSSNAWSVDGTNVDVGHTFISIEQNGKVRVFGFYPSIGVSPYSPSTTSVLVDDSNHHYDLKVTINVSGSRLNDVINYTNNYNSVYNLNSFNCTDFALNVASRSGVSLPDNVGSWPGGSGSNPGNLGQDIRASSSFGPNTTINRNGGTSISNTGSCP